MLRGNNGAPYGITRPSASPLRGRPSGVQIARTVDLSNPQLTRGNNGAPYEITRRYAPRPYGVALRAIAAAARRRRTRSLSMLRGKNGAPYGIRTHVPALRGPQERRRHTTAY
jgi:hypothetical protein